MSESLHGRERSRPPWSQARTTSHPRTSTRSANSVATEKRLEQEGFKEEWKSVSVTDPRTWKNRLDEVRNQHLYLYLLQDSIEAYLMFYQRYHGVDVGDMAALAEYVEKANGLSGSEKNLLETWKWLQHVDAPTELEH